MARNDVWRSRDRAVDVAAAALAEAFPDEPPATLIAAADRVIGALERRGVELPSAFRQRVRANMPAGYDGFVIEDIDLGLHLVRTHGDNYRSDERGQFFLAEAKYGAHTDLTEGQRRSFGLLDTLLHRGDGTWGCYWGFHRVNYGICHDGRLTDLRVNGCPISPEGFRDWLSFDEDLHRWAGRWQFA